MAFDECLENDCTQLAMTEIEGGHWADGVDFDGTEVEFWLDKWVCAVGHRYHIVDETKTRIRV